MDTWTKLQSSLESASDPSHNTYPFSQPNDCFLVIWLVSNRLFFRQLGPRNTCDCKSGQCSFQPTRSLDSIGLCPILAEKSAAFVSFRSHASSRRTFRPRRLLEPLPRSASRCCSLPSSRAKSGAGTRG